MKKEQTQFIVLRKIPYGETSWIVSSLSLEYGKLDFIIKGARKTSKRSFPVIDLFREIKGSCALKNSGLSKVTSPDLIANFDSLAVNQGSYMAACNIAQFVTANTQPMLQMPLLYAALKNIFTALAAESINSPWFTFVKLVYLYEQGLLPDTLCGSESRQAEAEKELLLQSIIQYACEGGELDVDPSYWPLFSSWVDSLCSFNGLSL